MAQRGTPNTPPGHEGHLSALGNLLEESFPDPAVFFDHGLALLTQQLKLDCALIARQGGPAPEAMWCHCPKEKVHKVLDAPFIQVLSHLVLAHPRRTTVVLDLHAHEEIRSARVDPMGTLRSFLGTVLWQDGRPGAVLMVLDHKVRRFPRHELALVAAVANLFARTLEVENLKYELRVTRDALDLATAIVEDSAFESATSGLPSAHYLDIWLKANLYLARRRDETMAVVGWHQEPTATLLKRLRELAETFRGEDLLVDMGRGDFLLLMPHTDQEGAERPLERLRGITGLIPMGATLWDPGHIDDREDITFQVTRGRVAIALAESRANALKGKGRVAWHVHPGSTEKEKDPVIQPV